MQYFELHLHLLFTLFLLLVAASHTHQAPPPVTQRVWFLLPAVKIQYKCACCSVMSNAVNWLFQTRTMLLSTLLLNTSHYISLIPTVHLSVLLHNVCQIAIFGENNLQLDFLGPILYSHSIHPEWTLLGSLIYNYCPTWYHCLLERAAVWVHWAKSVLSTSTGHPPRFLDGVC